MSAAAQSSSHDAAGGAAITASALTSTVLTASSASLPEGADETASIKVTSASGTPTGSVQLYVNGGLLDTVTLSSGAASLTVSTAGVAPGKYPAYAQYTGSSGFAASKSATVTVTITSPTPTVTAVYASPTDIQQGTVTTLMARVGRTSASGTPAGTVTFYTGGSALGSAALVDGVATFQGSTAGLPLGAYPISARYSGGSGDAASTSAAIQVSITPAVDVLTHRNDNSRTGLQAYETTLTTSNVNPTSFGKIATYTTDGYIYAQPLYVSNYTMSDNASHNVIYAATAAGSIYAFDTDGKNPTAGYLWKTSVIPAGEQVVVVADYFGCGNPSPNTTILGTPVIDRGLGVMYVVSKTKSVSGSTATYYQRIHAISLRDGTEKLNGPTLITASVPGTGDGTVSGMVSFNPLYQNERAAMLEADGAVWITWASHCDIRPYHGWTIAYNAGDVSKQIAVYNNTPNGSDGGIWMVSGGLSADNAGNIFTAAGNGTFDANTGGPDLADAMTRLAYSPAFNSEAASLTAADWFDPSDQQDLSENDLDFGTADVLLFDDPGSSTPHLAASADKTGEVYLIDRDHMGGYDTGTNGPNSLNGDLQDFASPGRIFANFGYFNKTLYIGPNSSPLIAYTYEPGTASAPGRISTTPASETTFNFSPSYSVGGTQPMISANGTSNAIVWSLDTAENYDVLYAFDATNLATELYSSSTAANSRDEGPAPVKFTVPVVANGHVFVGGQGQLVEYGLLKQ